MKRDVVLLLAIFAVAMLLVNPAGDFPLDDDWDFALATWAFARTGHFHFTPFTATSLHLQVLWGALWTLLFGESFNVLRASTLFLAACAIIAFYALLRQLSLSRAERFVACAALMFHPIFFWSSATYMTHVPYVFLSIAAMAAFLRGIDRRSAGWVVGGALLVVASMFVRQTGIVPFPAKTIKLLARLHVNLAVIN